MNAGASHTPTHLLVLLLLSCARIAGADVTAPESPPLDRWLDAHLAQPRYAGAAWGVKIVSIPSGRILYEHNAAKLLKPASNAKLYTGALALDRLGPEYRIRTSLHARQRPDAKGELAGDLLVFGRGDPSFAARFNKGSHADNLSPLAMALEAAGVKRIQGGIVADESAFRGAPLGSGWMWDDLTYYYGAEASALTVEDNVVDLVLKPGAAIGDPVRIFTLPQTGYLSFSNRAVTVATNEKARTWLHRPLGRNVVYLHGQLPLGASNVYDAVTVHRPALWFGTLLKESLQRRSIAVDGTVRAVDWLDRELAPWPTNDWPEIASFESPPLKEILAKMMKPSQNLYAHLLLLQVGARVMETNQTYRTTEDAGLAELNRFLIEAGIRKGQVLLEEGSGLSRGALLSPNATVKLLLHMDRHPHREAYRQALPLAGVDGTLRRRMKGTPAAGNARAKTGTLRYVHTLSGYVTTRAGEELVYSLMLNNCDCDEGDVRADLDAIVVRLAGLEEPVAGRPQ